ncbi:RNase A-like domain-containing protein [Pseudomonas sp. MPB26]|uniref:RNase A-like domain-containing protein n=1 Tax=Pseudomonas sp. MPB26 TaxID=3388491 RepID=UPI0039852C70
MIVSYAPRGNASRDALHHLYTLCGGTRSVPGGIPTRSVGTINDRATAEREVSIVLDENKAKIDKFLKGTSNQIVIIQKTKCPVGTSFKKNSTTAVSGKEIYLIIRRDHNMKTGYRIHTGFPNP